MKRGEVWTVAGDDYAGKPRPAVIVQDDRFGELASITVCLITTNPTPASLVRVLVQSNEANGLSQASWLMGDKVTTLPKTKLGHRIGRLDDETMSQLNRAMLVFLGLAG